MIKMFNQYNKYVLQIISIWAWNPIFNKLKYAKLMNLNSFYHISDDFEIEFLFGVDWMKLNSMKIWKIKIVFYENLIWIWIEIQKTFYFIQFKWLVLIQSKTNKN